MSVRAGDRSEGKIQAVDASRQLVEYTYDRVHDKTFGKSDRWLGGVRMRMGSDKQGRERRRLTKLAQKEIQGKIKPGTTRNSYESWVANAQRGDTYFQVKRMESHFKSLERMIDNGNNP